MNPEMMETPTNLFAPLQLRGVTFRNRVGVSPMCQYSSEDGFADDWHFVHLGSRAVGGAGIVIAEATAVTPEGRISPQDLGIWKDDHVEGLARCAQFIERHGAVAGIQLAHAGRKASTKPPWQDRGYVSEAEGGWRPILAPSPVPFHDAAPVPKALSEDGIARVIGAFREGARRTREAGFRVVEIHAAHGYLLHQFLSPLSNHRTDAYGGSFENRIRLTLDVTRAVREVWPAELPLFVRISATDWAEGGWNIEQSVALAQALQPLGTDVIDCSSGGLIPGVEIPAEPGYQVRFAERVRREAEIATAAVGLITKPEQAEEILQRGQADLVLLARQLLRDPYWPLRAARHLEAQVEWPVQYHRASD